MDKSKFQSAFEESAKITAKHVRFLSEAALQLREKTKLKNIENAKRYAYEQAYVNKYGALEYIKRL